VGAAAFAFGVVSYLVFLASFLYAIGFVGNFGVPKSIDSGAEGSAAAALLGNALLLGLFAVQHSVMARSGFKGWWTSVVPQTVERSTYVLISSLLLFLLFWGWQPLPGVVWSVENRLGVLALEILFWSGWLLALYATFAIDHFDLFGLRQVWFRLRGKSYSPVAFSQPRLYALVRHPLLLGFLIAFWSTPTMTVGHLLFSAAITAYTIAAIQLEERDLIAAHGDSYRRYQRQVRMLLPLPRRKVG
jgi:protein-S-isoprenylcysteine O-methyltransferase Ste14